MNACIKLMQLRNNYLNYLGSFYWYINGIASERSLYSTIINSLYGSNIRGIHFYTFSLF